MQSTYPAVALAKAEQYEQQTVQNAVESLFRSLNLDRALYGNLRNQKILIKPNLLMKRRPEEVTTTHPAVVKAVIRHLQELGANQITIADSPGGLYTKAQLTAIYAATGMAQVASETGVTLNFETGYQEVSSPTGKLCHWFDLINPVVEADLILSIGKLKTHAMTGLSGGVKNLFGCIPGLQKPELHYRFQNKHDFCKMLVDLARLVCPRITVIDAIESMEGDGPSGGEKRNTGFLCACESPFVLDLFLCDLIGFTPGELPTVAEGLLQGLCPVECAEIVIWNPDKLPLQIPDFKKPSSQPVNFSGSLPGFLQNAAGLLGEHFLSPKPVIQKNKCIACAKCAESCPAKTISIQNGRAQIELKHCIKCFCCHEMCPVRAISIVKPKFFHW